MVPEEIVAGGGWTSTPRPQWPHVGPWWRFWGQPTPVSDGYRECDGCGATYWLIWIESRGVSSGQLACASCGAELFSWEAPREYRIEAVPREAVPSAGAAEIPSFETRVLAMLEPHQRPVAALMMRGLSNWEIAKELGLAPSEVKAATVATFKAVQRMNSRGQTIR
jgi:Bacterial regulatory proteins, luxR family